MDNAQIYDFIQRWKKSGAAERANYSLFLTELCDLLDVPRPEPTQPDDAENAYVFERSVTFHHGDGSTSDGRIDLYKRGCFVLEAKQGIEQDQGTQPLSQAMQQRQARRHRGTAVRETRAWDVSMLRAKGQAEQYARALPAAEGRPPFLIVVDVGHSIELYAEFTRTGGAYLPFPDPRSHRILLPQLADPGRRAQLRTVWTDPLALDPARRSARVTRDIADRLARLARLMEAGGNSPQAVATFLMRCIFTMFAEDVRLLPENRFRLLLESLRGRPETFVPMVEELWSKMKTGGFSTALCERVMRFNGGLFEEATALAVDADQLELLIEAAKADWREVEPAIFGTLLERALNPQERHKLGAHYTPRTYVERLVIPTVMEPLRQEWAAVQAAAVTLAREGNQDQALTEVQEFHRRLCEVRVLDPACGSGNFLYVTLEHLKRLEGEVLNALESLDDRQYLLEMQGFTVDPHQLLGIEVNPRAAAITELVLWIGYLQWHFRTRGEVAPPEPIIKNFHNIECRDAVLTWERTEPMLDASGEPLTRWDGVTMRQHPVTGEAVPDETARVPVLRYLNPRKAEWPATDFVVGNPPFIGNWRMREALGDGYAEAVRAAHGDLPDSCDYVMYWWDKAGELARAEQIKRFGFITTNSLRQTFNRKVLEKHLSAQEPLSVIFAIPDHPWVNADDGAAVRIAMTVGEKGACEGVLQKVMREHDDGGEGLEVELAERQGIIHADLTIGANVAGTMALEANRDMSNPGVKLHGAGFIISNEEAVNLGLGRIPGLEAHIREYLNGKDITRKSRNVLVIDLFDLSEREVQVKFPEVYQWVLTRVKPERDVNPRRSRREKWWIFGEPNPKWRSMCAGLRRYIATSETAKHRFFVFLDASVLPDNMLVNIALEDAFFLGVLSSRIHVTWALASGGTLEDRPRYNKSRCFEPFPFPEATEEQKARIRELGERLDTHRKRQQELHPALTLTDIYNVLEKLRTGEALTRREQTVHEQGLVSVLRQIHDELDTAVFAAYGWPVTLETDEILMRLVELNAVRTAEEQQGKVRWLRPEFQNQAGQTTAPTEQLTLEMPSDEKPAIAGQGTTEGEKLAWPRALPEQAQAIRDLLTSLDVPSAATTLARRFRGARTDRVESLLETLASLGQARRLDDGRYAAEA